MRTNLAFAVALLAIVAWGAWHRSVDLDPPSLWLDDAWVAVLGRAPLGEALAHGSSTPPLFTVAESACIRALPDPEVAAQLFPFVASLLAIVATTLAAWRITGSKTGALIAAALVACDPLAIIYAARAKQYSSDLLVAALLLALSHAILESPTRRRLAGWVAFASVSIFLSTSSVFVAVPLGGCVLVALVRRGQDVRALAVASLAFGAALVALYVLVLRGASNESLARWWKASMLSSHPPGEAAALVGASARAWLTGTLHGGVAPMPGVPEPFFREGPIPALPLALVLVGLGFFKLQRAARPLAIGIALVPLALVAASAAGRYPLGGGRTEIFLAPLVAVLVASGFVACESAPFPLVRRAWRLVAVLVLGVQLPLPRVPHYPFRSEPAAAAVQALAKTARPGDTIWVNRLGTYQLAYSGPWSFVLVEDASLGTGYHPEPAAPGLRVLDGPEALAGDAKPARVLVLVTSDVLDVRSAFERGLRAAGYRPSTSEAFPLVIWVR